MCYTYDELDRVVKRTFKELNDTYISEETYSYDAASNLTSADNGALDTDFVYDTNNRLTAYGNKTVSYDADGNMLSDGDMTYEYDSANRLIKAGDNEYTYNAEDVRIRNLCGEYDTTYVYDTNVKLSRLLQKTTNNITTKYVYGKGLIGEQKEGDLFKVYHFDYRGSTVAITDMSGSVTDTFQYDTYGKMISHIGNSYVIFGFNGRDGVITDKNGLLYMRARYYSPDMQRFINADVIHGKISRSVTLNRYAYANGNPVSFVDPFGLSADSRDETPANEIASGSDEYINILCQLITEGTGNYSDLEDIEELVKALKLIDGNVQLVRKGDYIIIKGNRGVLAEYGIKQTRIRADNIEKFKGLNDLFESQSFKGAFKNSFDAPGVILDAVGVVANTVYEINQYESTEDKVIVGTYTATTEIVSTVATAAASAGATALAAKIGSAAGTVIAPGIGTAIGLAAGVIVGFALDSLFGWIKREYIKDIVENN